MDFQELTIDDQKVNLERLANNIIAPEKILGQSSIHKSCFSITTLVTCICRRRNSCSKNQKKAIKNNRKADYKREKNKNKN